ncbi:MAG: gliding motility-associated-like protein, partial [Luteibaculaceae bacterium]
LSYIVTPSGIGVSEYTVTNITDSKGCSNVGEGLVTIEVKPSPTVDFSGVDISGCPPITPFFTNNSTGTYVSCTWNFGDGNTATGSCTGVSHVYNAPGAYTVTLELTTAEGCIATGRKENIVEVFSKPKADFAIGSQKPTIRNSVVNFTNTSKGGEFFLWDFAGLDQSSQKDPNFQFPFEDEGVYEVSLLATNSQGCADSTARTISVEGVLNVSIPNSFTPDGDGKNDIFIPVLNGHDEEFHDYEFNVFDRWGVPVFSTRDLIEGWDGTDNKGKHVKTDSYVYSVKIRSKYSSERKEFQGYVNITR